MTEVAHYQTAAATEQRSNDTMPTTTHDQYDFYPFRLYHGTSSKALERILKEGRLNATEDPDDPEYSRVSLTTDPTVAAYYACEATSRDTESATCDDCEPMIIELDGHVLGALYYSLRPGDHGWWEHEVICDDQIEPLDWVLVRTQTVLRERLRDYKERGRDAFYPTTMRSADYQLGIDKYLLHEQAMAWVTQARLKAA